MSQRVRLIPRSPSTWALVAVLGLGALVRLWLMLQWRPGFLGYPDTVAYMLDAVSGQYPFFDPLRVVGYGVFIRQLHDLRPDLSLVTLVQHGLGLATALMLYTAVRLAGVRSRWVAVFPAAVVALGGSQIMFEHALLSETLWQFLITASVLVAVWASKLGGAAGAARWAALAAAVLAGLLLGTSVTVRLTGVFIIPLLAIWIAAATPTGRWPRLGLGAALAVFSIVPIYAMSAWQEDETGRFGLTRNGAMNFYGRVAPWADCSKFTPPPGTKELCETRPRSQRPGHEVYIFAASPATTRWAVGSLVGILPPEGVKQITAWSRAAVLGQPFTYLDAVASESARLIDPGVYPGFSTPDLGGYGLGPEAYPQRLRELDPPYTTIGVWKDNYPGGGEQKTAPLKGFYRYEENTRIPPVVMAALFALTLLAPFAARGPERRLAWLVSPAALLLLVAPIATSMYDYRYAVPVYGLLACAAGIGGWAVATSTRRWWSSRNPTAATAS